MKTTTIKTPTAELMILEWQDDYEIVGKALFANSKQKGVLTNLMNLEGYTLLGKPDEIREEDARKLVQYLTRRDLTITPKNYSKGKDGRFEDITFTESLLSLIETEIYWDVNPFEKPNGENYYYEERHGFDEVELLWDGGSYNEDLSIFEEAEKKTFDRKRTLIFVKN